MHIPVPTSNEHISTIDISLYMCEENNRFLLGKSKYTNTLGGEINTLLVLQQWYTYLPLGFDQLVMLMYVAGISKTNNHFVHSCFSEF